MDATDAVPRYYCWKADCLKPRIQVLSFGQSKRNEPIRIQTIMTPVQSARKRNRCQARENIKPAPSAGKQTIGAKRGKTRLVLGLLLFALIGQIHSTFLTATWVKRACSNQAVN